MQLTDAGTDPYDAATGDLKVGHGHAGGHAAGPAGQGRRQPQGVHPGLVVGQQSGRDRDQLRDQLGHPVPVEQLNAWPRSKPSGRSLWEQQQPCHLLQSQRSVPLLVKLAMQSQAGPGQRDEGRRVAQLVQLRGQRPPGPARGARGQPSRLDDQHPADPGASAEHRRGQPDHSTPNHQHVRVAIQDGGHARVKGGLVARLDSAFPERAPHASSGPHA